MSRFLALALAATACGLPGNPPVEREIVWIDAETEDLARRACYDCHSNETMWKSGHRVPIVNGMVKKHVREGRCHMNFSDWDGPNEPAWEAPEEVLDGEMPLRSYSRFHGPARLTDTERVALADGITRTFEIDPPADGEPCEDD
jgi:hypothetical protein